MNETKNDSADSFLHDLRSALRGLVELSSHQLKALCTATMQQLVAVYGDHPKKQEIIDAVIDVQKKHNTFVDPKDNWYTKTFRQHGRGFDMQILRKDPSLLASKFDRLANVYDDWTVGNQSKIETFIVRCANHPNSVLRNGSQKNRVLDIACGIGLQGQVLRMCGFQGELVGTDISPGMVQRVMERGSYDFAYVSDANLSLECTEKGISSNCCDVAICTGAMELLDHQGVLKRISEMLRPGGEFWLSFQEEVLGQQNPTQHQNVQGITKERSMQLLKEAGFECVVAESCSDAFYTPSPAQDGTQLPVPYIFILAKKDK